MKNILITGASSGIGYALAEIYAKNSDNLILVARRGERLRELKTKLENQYRVDVSVEVMDLTKKENLLILAEKYKNIDMLINNAGVGQFGSFESYDINTDETIINLNILTPVMLTKLFAKQMKKGSKIVNTASTAGFQPVPLMAVYSAAKSFVVDFTLAVQREYKDVNIVLFCPGETQTEFQQKADRPKSSPLRGPIPTAEEVASYFYKEVGKNKNFIICGIYNRILIFLTRFIGKKTLARFIYKTQVKLGDKNAKN